MQYDCEQTDASSCDEQLYKSSSSCVLHVYDPTVIRRSSYIDPMGGYRYDGVMPLNDKNETRLEGNSSVLQDACEQDDISSESNLDKLRWEEKKGGDRGV